LHHLPAQQIVEASLKAFGIPLDEIIEAAAEEIQALEAYIQHGARHTQGVLQDASAQVAKLEGQIVEVKRLMELQVRTQQGVVKSRRSYTCHGSVLCSTEQADRVGYRPRPSPQLAVFTHGRTTLADSKRKDSGARDGRTASEVCW
jgi:hypothetical protein